MRPPSRGIDGAFRDLERALAARRLASLDGRARLVVLVLVVLTSGFVYWQTRIPLDGFCRAHGAAPGALALAAVLGGWALAGASLAAWRQGTMAVRTPGPEWLALPVPPARVARHLLAEARWPAAAIFPPAAASLAAGFGLMPPLWLALLAAAFLVAWLELTRAGAAVARRLAAPNTPPARGLPAATRALLAGARGARVRAIAAPTWRREPAWRALARLDRRASTRSSAARTRLTLALAWGLAGLLAWALPAPPATRRALAFAAFAGACTALGAWAIARTCADPDEALRPLPLSWLDAWRARAATLAALVLAATLANAAIAATQAPGPSFALEPLLAWPLPGLAIAALGLNYALTLTPRTTVAENLYYGWLGVTVASSLMIPFLGWAVLLAGLVHTALRLPRWWRPEVA